MSTTVSSVVARWATLFKKATVAFFDIREDDTGIQKGARVAVIGLKRTMYAMADYWLMIASGAYIIIIDQTLHWGWFGLFLAMYAFDFVVAATFIIIWKVTGEDITLGDSYRRAADAIHAESKVAGVLAFTGVCIKAAFWDGPEHIIIFFRKELRTWQLMGLVLVLLVALQAAIWTPIYVLGFETLTDLFGYLWGLL